MANYLTDIIRRAEKYGAKNNLGRLLSALEVGANMGTSSIAQMGGGLSYVPAAIMGGDKAGQAVKGSVERAFTYEPRTQGARNFFSKVGEYAAPVMQYGSQKVDQAADAAFAATGSPVVGAAVKTLPTALSVAADRIRIGKAAPDRMEMTAYHGSPHDFDEFSLSRIGTGEGAQAYGHGLYFAESPDVANQYKNFLGKLEIYHNGNNVGVFDESPSANAAHQIRASGGDVQKAINRAGAIYSGKWRDEVIASIKKLGPGDVSEKVGGRLYTVDIPDEAVANFLDWDKPLSQQPQAVRDALVGIRESAAKSFPSLRGNDSITGQALYDAYKAHRGGNQKAASEAFSAAGIPGIRYLDQESRDSGKGTSNFVVFDDKLVKVLKKE